MKITITKTLTLVVLALFISWSSISTGTSRTPMKTNFAQMASCTLNVFYTQSYCGGARPPQHLLDTLAKQKPLINSTILLRNGKKKIKVKTNSKGQAIVELQADVNTCYSLTSQIDASIPQINRKCKKALTMAYGSFVAPAKGPRDFELVYKFTCDPCDPMSKKRQ